MEIKNKIKIRELKINVLFLLKINVLCLFF